MFSPQTIFSGSIFRTARSAKEIIKWLGSLLPYLLLLLQRVRRLVIKSFLLCVLPLSLIRWHTHATLLGFNNLLSNTITSFAVVLSFFPACAVIMDQHCTLSHELKMMSRQIMVVWCKLFNNYFHCLMINPFFHINLGSFLRILIDLSLSDKINLVVSFNVSCFNAQLNVLILHLQCNDRLNRKRLLWPAQTINRL